MFSTRRTKDAVVQRSRDGCWLIIIADADAAADKVEPQLDSYTFVRCYDTVTGSVEKLSSVEKSSIRLAGFGDWYSGGPFNNTIDL